MQTEGVDYAVSFDQAGGGGFENPGFWVPHRTFKDPQNPNSEEPNKGGIPGPHFPLPIAQEARGDKSRIKYLWHRRHRHGKQEEGMGCYAGEVPLIRVNR